jgi:hypothetical protein
VLKTLATPVRLLYVPRLLVPVAFTALLAPRWLLPALAPVAVNVLSQFPTAPQVHSHYATLTVPFLLAASAHGVGRLVARAGTWGDRQALAALAAVSLGSIHMQHRAGSLPLVGGRFDRNAYAADARQAALDTLVDLLPREASVSAPDHLLPHLAERLRLFRAPPPARRIDYLVLSTDHRALFAGRQELWRSDEERLVRGTLSRRKYGVFAVVGPYLVLRVGWPVRSWARTRYVDFDPDPRARAAHLPAGPSLTLAGWGRSPQPHGTHVVLLLVATRPWPLDLGLELGWGPMRPHLDRQDPTSTYAFQPFDGVFLPMYVRVGEVVRTEVDLPATAAELSGGLYLGARRVDGSRLDPSGPHWVRLP